MTSHLTTHFSQSGTISRLSGNSPLLLRGKDQVWCVLCGHVEVFAVPLNQGCPAGPRDHFFSAAQGDLLFGLDLDPDGCGLGFQAVGYPGTQVAGLPLPHLRQWHGEQLGVPGDEAEMVRGIDTWVAGLARGLTKDILPRPRADLLLPAEVGIIADADQVAYPQRGPDQGLLWLRFVRHGGLFLGTEDVSADDQLLPLAPDSWIQLLKGSRLETLTTGGVLSRNLIWPALAAFHALAIQTLFLNTCLNAADTYNLLAEKARQAEQAKHRGLRQLVSVLSPGHSVEVPEPEADDRLWKACIRIGNRLGIALKAPRRPLRETAPRPLAIEEVARASRVHLRRIKLPHRWWCSDLGPLVGFESADFGKDHCEPVALLPRSTGRYDIIAGDNGRRRKVTAGVAAGIAPQAYTFYRCLPDRALSGTDLAKFGLRGCIRDLLWIVGIAGIIGLMSLITPLVTGYLFSDIIPNAEPQRIWILVAILAGFGVTGGLFEFTRNLGILRVESRLHYLFESALWARLLRLPILFFRRFEAGDLAARVTGLNEVRQMVAGPVVTTLVGGIFALFNLLLLFYYHLSLALAASGLLALALITISALSLLQLRCLQFQIQIEGMISGRVLQLLNAVAKLRICGAENAAFALWARDYSRQQELTLKSGLAENRLTAFNAIFMLLSLMVLFYWLNQQGNSAPLSTGVFLAFNAAYANLHAAVFQMVPSLQTVAMAVAYVERINPILQQVPEVDTDKSDPGELSGRIEISHLTFCYDTQGPLILNDISLRIEPGSFVAVVGPSGSGKSTLIRLLLGFERPNTGTIYYDDQDLAELDVSAVRRHMGVVLQDGNILAGDIFTNIIGSHPLVLTDAWEAAAKAGLDDDIRQMPMGMHTVVMEGAATLSGGQRQRLMIARAIVARPRILIFDEATSALDNRTQALVAESLRNLEATRLVVAHRLSTIQDADCIYVMDRGRIVERGNYTELIECDGHFRRLAQRQII